MNNRRWVTAWRLFKSGEHQEFLARTFRLLKPLIHKTTKVEYSAWRKRWVELGEEDKKQIVERVELLPHCPFFILFLDARNSDAVSLLSTIESVVEQIYCNWLLCITNGELLEHGLSDKIRDLKDSRIQLVNSKENIIGDWVVELTPGIRLHEAALCAASFSLVENPKISIIYSDHEHVDPTGNYCDPHMKPDWNPDLFAAMNYVGPLVFCEKKLWEKHKDESIDQYDFLLKATGNLSIKNILHIPLVLASIQIGGDGKHLEPPCKRIVNDLPTPAPRVSILIPTRNQGRMLGRCLKSIYKETSYKNFEIVLVDHETTQTKALKVIEEFKANENFQVVGFSGSFNFSAIMNTAATVAKGQVLVLLNNDTEIVDPGWLTELVSQVSRPEVGIVGALLLFGDGTIQHAGIHPDTNGLMRHGHKHLSGESSGYFNRLKAVHEVAAVTGACLAIEKSTWIDLGGLDEENLTVAYNDVDICFKAREKGLRVIFTPYSKVVHHESVSRGVDDNPVKNMRLRQEQKTMSDRWNELLTVDPAYSPNLSCDEGGFNLAREPRDRNLKKLDINV